MKIEVEILPNNLVAKKEIKAEMLNQKEIFKITSTTRDPIMIN